MHATLALRAARDELLSLRTDYDGACREFRWPDVGDTFNFAHDWFDPIARGNPAVGPGDFVEQYGSRASYSFDELARRSDQVARALAGHGVGRGDSRQAPRRHSARFIQT